MSQTEQLPQLLLTGPSFPSRPSPLIEEAKEALVCNTQDQIVMTTVVSISKGQPCPTSPGVWEANRFYIVSFPNQ